VNLTIPPMILVRHGTSQHSIFFSKSVTAHSKFPPFPVLYLLPKCPPTDFQSPAVTASHSPSVNFFSFFPSPPHAYRSPFELPAFFFFFCFFLILFLFGLFFFVSFLPVFSHLCYLFFLSANCPVYSLCCFLSFSYLPPLLFQTCPSLFPPFRSCFFFRSLLFPLSIGSLASPSGISSLFP